MHAGEPSSKRPTLDQSAEVRHVHRDPAPLHKFLKMQNVSGIPQRPRPARNGNGNRGKATRSKQKTLHHLRALPAQKNQNQRNDELKLEHTQAKPTSGEGVSVSFQSYKGHGIEQKQQNHILPLQQRDQHRKEPEQDQQPQKRRALRQHRNLSPQQKG